MDVFVALEAVAHPLHVVRARIECALGRPILAELEVGSPQAFSPEEVLGTRARIEVGGGHGAPGVHHGLVTSITAVGTALASAQRAYKLTIRSAVDVLRLRRDARIFRGKNAPAIVKEVAAAVGVSGAAHVEEVQEPPPVREHVTQWNEDDLQFLTRICEEDGLYYRLDPADGFDALVVCDTSSAAPAVLEGPLRFVDVGAVTPDQVVAFGARRTRARRAGKVEVRDRDPANPSLALIGRAERGVAAETAVEVYLAPGRFRSEGDGAREARLTLEALRAEADVLTFETTAFALRPGVSFEADAALAVGPDVTGAWFVTATSLDWSQGGPEGVLHVRAIPLATPYRLPRVTPHPRVAGMLSATVTGAPGEEIHTDAGGHARVHFAWDRHGPDDHTSSLPVRVMQANLPGSLLVPRVGWEVLVGFEDGDPDRPYVLGRSFNGKQLPPFSLPANKTITAMGTVSSPGGARSNMVHLDDGAGRQHLVFGAGFGKTTTVGTNMNSQTVGKQNTTVLGSQSWSVGADQTVSVKSKMSTSAGTQSATVGGNQTLTLNATAATVVGSETVLVGGALVEKVGNPASGLGEFVKAAVIAGAGEIPGVGPFLSKGLSWGSALYNGYQQGGWSGALEAAGQTAAGEIAGQIPGGDAIVAAADGAGLTPWSEKAKQRAAAQEGGGGGAGPGGAGGGAAAAAPGFRKLLVDGVVTEAIGAVHAIQSPGSIKWTTLGASLIDVGASHSTSAVKISRLTMAASADTASATSVRARTAIGRNVKTAHTLKAGGAVAIDASGEVGIKAGGALSVKVGGAMKLEGGTVVFEVPGASVSVHGGGLTLSAPEVVINGKNQHSGKESTS